MKLKDDITLSIAAAVSDVLEGKVKEEGKYPHDMFHPETGEKKVAKDEAEHKALADKGYTHDKPEVDEAGEPKAKGEKDFKGAHKVKKSGEKEDGTVVKEEVTITIDEAKLKAGKGKVKVDIDHTGEGIPAAEKKFKLKFKKHSRDGYDVSGEKKNILAFLQSNLYSMDTDDIEELFPELLEAKSKFQKPQVKKAVALALKMGGNMTGAIKKIEQMAKGLSKDTEVAAALQLANESVTEEVLDEAHAMNKVKTKMQEDKERYQKFFKSALKKFGVTSPGELEGEKKKEFFNYVDKNYEADNETDKDEGTLPPALQKAIDKKNGKKTDDDEKEVKEETIAEAQIKTSFESDEMKNVGGDKAAKKMGIKISFKKGKGDGMMGSDAGIFTGDEKKLVKYFQDFMGFEGKTFKELQKEYS